MDPTYTPKNPPVVLAFSGHDPTGGAGISADIEAISSQGCHAASVITCLTVQDSRDVRAVIPVDADVITQAARAVLDDMPVAAFKIGLVGSVEAAEAIQAIARDYPRIPLILDPVLASGAGTELGNQALLEALRDLLLPVTAILTPNTLEASALAPGADTLDAMAKVLMQCGCDHVLLTGTHDGHDAVVNRLYHNQREIDAYEWPRLPNEYHGSGCTLASSLAALVAIGLDPLSAAREAQEYTWHALKNGYRPGTGQHLPNRLFWAQDDSDE